MQTLRTALRGASRGILAYALALTMGMGPPPPPPPPVVASGRHRLRGPGPTQEVGRGGWTPSSPNVVSAFMRAPSYRTQDNDCRGKRRNEAKLERRAALRTIHAFEPVAT